MSRFEEYITLGSSREYSADNFDFETLNELVHFISKAPSNAVIIDEMVNPENDEPLFEAGMTIGEIRKTEIFRELINEENDNPKPITESRLNQYLRR